MSARAVQLSPRRAEIAHRRPLPAIIALGLAATLTLATMLAGVLSSEAAATETTIWAATAKPSVTADAETTSVELGTVFTSSANGSVTALRFYKDAANRGPHVGKLWSDQGALLGVATFSSETASGWQQATLATSVPILAGQRYTVSYRAPFGRYAGDHGVFSNGRTVKRGSLTATAGVYTYGSGRPTQVWQGSSYYADVAFAAATTPSPTATPTATVKPTASAQPTATVRPTTTPTATVRPTTTPTSVPPVATPTPGGWPGASNTGVPAGTALTAYTGPCTITAANTRIDAKTINCNLNIRAAGVTITKSLINGTVATDENSTGYSFTLSDSEVRVGNREGTGVGAVDFTAIRVHVNGGNRSMHCYRNCVIQDSYVHGQFRDSSGRVHESGIRMGSGATIRHNTITCDAPDVPPDAGCSAGLTGYGDFAAVKNNVIDSNYFKATTGGFCAYGGSSLGKPFSSGTQGIVFRNNVFERGPGGKCGYWGPITSFNAALPGNVWSGNAWADGGNVPGVN